MTYFGVNYYLSGMHSYAAGDPVPVPTFVYVAVIVLASFSLAAILKYNSYQKPGEGRLKRHTPLSNIMLKHVETPNLRRLYMFLYGVEDGARTHDLRNHNPTF